MAKSNATVLNSLLPILRPLLLMAGLGAAIAIGIGLFSWARGSQHVALYNGLNDKALSEVTAMLDGASIPYRLGPGHGTVRVPEKSLTRARMLLASEGLPGTSDSGLEFMKESPGLGVSQFIESARYQHALETELSRSISSIRQIQGARVHLAVPRPTAFTRDQRQASASVLLEMFPGAQLDRSQVQAIVNLVSTAIPNLDASRVSVVDQTGRLLSNRPGDEGMDLIASQFELARNLEKTLSRRIENLLLPLTGPGRFSVQVHADMDFTENEQAIENFKPDPLAIRSEKRSTMSTGSSRASGAPGAASNQPGGPDSAAGVTRTSDGSSSEQRSFELDRELSYTRQQVGRVQRLTVAVLVDNIPRANSEGNVEARPLDQAEMDRITGLVRDAVGYSAQRGDSVTVLNSSFLPMADIEPMDPLPIWEQAWARDMARNIVGAIALLALLLGVVRPTAKQFMATPLFPMALGGANNAGLGVLPVSGEYQSREQTEQPAGQLQLANDKASLNRRAEDEKEALPYEKRLDVARDMVREDPKRVAQVVRGWVSSDA